MSVILGTLPNSSAQAQAEMNAMLARVTAQIARTAGYVQPGSIQGTGGGGAGHIAPLSVSTPEIAVGAITAASGIIGALAVGTAEIANLAVTSAKIAGLAVEEAKIANLAVTNAKIANLAVDAAKIASLAVEEAKIGNLAVTEAKIGNLAVTNAKIALLAVQSAQIDNLAVTTAKINDLAVTNAKVLSLDGDKINVNTLTADRLVATSASADVLLARLTHTGSLVATTGLSAVSANLGSITAGTITGAIMRSAASGARWQGDTTGITLWNAANEITFKADTSTGKITTLAGIGGANKIRDSGFEDGFTDWTVYFGADVIDTTTSKFGTKSAKLIVTGGNGTSFIKGTTEKVSENTPYTFSYWYKTGSGATSVSMFLRWYNSSGVQVGTDTFLSIPGAASNWTRAVVTGTAPATAAMADVFPAVVGPDGAFANVDGVQLEEGSLVTAYGPRPDENLSNTIGATQLAVGAVQGSEAGGKNHILADSIGVTELFVTSLSAITANMGTLTAGRIEGGSIDGGVIDALSINTAQLAANAVTAEKFSAVVGGQNKIDNATFQAGLTTGAGGHMYRGDANVYTVVADARTPSGYAIQVTALSGTNPVMYFGLNETPTDVIRAIPGRPYVSSFYGLSSSSSTTFRVATQFLDASGVQIGTTTLKDEPATTTGYKRIVNNPALAPAGAIYVRMYVQWIGPVAGNVGHFAAPQLEEGQVATAFIMGGSDSGTFTGGTFRTAPSGKRVQMDTTGVFAIDSTGGDTFRASALTGGVRWGKRASSSSEILIPLGTDTGWTSTGTSITIPVDADALVKLFVEVEFAGPAGPSYLQIGVHEAGDFATPLQIFYDESGSGAYQTQRTVAGIQEVAVPGTVNVGTTSKVASEITIRPSTTGDKTYAIYYDQKDSVNQVGGGKIRNRRIYAYTT